MKIDESGGDTERFSTAILNAALELTTEWGESFGRPIDERILAKYPDLTPDDIAELTRLSLEAEHHIYHLAEQELAGSICEYDIVPAAQKRFPWLNTSNASRLKNIGMFYARK